jgi:Tfp pilus assembly protein PilO
MTRKEFIDKITKNKKVKDYTLTIFFFLIFAFFVFFAIRPNIVTAFNLQKELQDLKVKDRKYEQTLFNIVNYQAVLETNRDNFFLLDEAVPSNPQVYKVIDDLRVSASASGVLTSRFDVSEVQLTKDKKQRKMQAYKISLETTSDINQVKGFIENFMSQRRLKTIDSLSITPDNRTENSFKIQMIIEGYYL